MKRNRELLVPAMAAPGRRQHHHHGRWRHIGKDPRLDPCGAARSAAIRRRRRRADRQRSRRTSPLYGPGDIVGIEQQAVTTAILRTDPRAGHHQLRIELPAGDRILRRGFSLALHSGRGGWHWPALASVDRPGGACRRRVFADGQVNAVTKRAVHHGAQRQRVSACQTNYGHGRTFTSTPAFPATPTSWCRRTWPRCCRWCSPFLSRIQILPTLAWFARAVFKTARITPRL